jgi:uncharacterized protein YggU (UPF0235/DUF167 family)
MYIHVKAVVNTKKERIEQLKKENHFIVSVREKAELNMANKRIILIIANHFSVPIGAVRIINGHQSPSKILSVEI